MTAVDHENDAPTGNKYVAEIDGARTAAALRRHARYLLRGAISCRPARNGETTAADVGSADRIRAHARGSARIIGPRTSAGTRMIGGATGPCSIREGIS